MLALESMHIPEAQRAQVLAHYERFADRIAGTVGRIPLIPTYLPEGLSGPVTRGGALHDAPPSIDTIDVPHAVGDLRPYLALDFSNLLWAVHRYAIGFESWTPTIGDPIEPAIARILLVPRKATPEQMAEVADALETALEETFLYAAFLSDGEQIAFWIPIEPDFSYPDMRLALHDVIGDVTDADGLADQTVHGTAPVHISVRTNAPGLGSTLPYTVVAGPELRVMLPIVKGKNGDFNFLEALKAPHGIDAAAKITNEPFGDRLKELGLEDLSYIKGRPYGRARPTPMYVPRATVITDSIAILQDGEPRTADQLIAELKRREADLPKSADRKYVYVQLKGYIEKTLGRGRKPAIVQDPDRRFRINHPPDDWPLPAQPKKPKDHEELISRLKTASESADSDAMEKAACEAFACLGFVATHVGGIAAPDGYIDAPLGSESYRVMLECKTSFKPMQRPDIYEASKYRDQYKATYCALIGPEFGDTMAIINEAKTHQVSVWSVDDVANCLRAGLNPHEMRPLFEPGVVEDHLEDLEWDRAHGFTRRVRLVCELVREAGWNAQLRAVADGRYDEAPHLTVEAAMFLVNEALTDANAKRAVAREEVEAAFAHLTDPLVAEAIKLTGADDAIAVTARHT